MEYLSHNLWLVWTSVMFICLILELSSGDFYVTCFAIGALISIPVALVGAPFWVQVVVWAICSMLSIWLVRPHLLKSLHKGGEDRRSNADALAGQIGEVHQLHHDQGEEPILYRLLLRQELQQRPCRRQGKCKSS